jgi:hypothetical protein
MGEVGSTSFQTPTCDVLELNNVFYSLGLKNNILSLSYMENLHCMVEFGVQEVIFKSQAWVVEKGFMLEVFIGCRKIQ